MPLTAGVVACGLNVGAYGSEVVRGAILAVSKDQHEAAKALNYSTIKKYRFVIIPQAIPIMIPTFGNLLIELLKLTAVCFTNYHFRSDIYGSNNKSSDCLNVRAIFTNSHYLLYYCNDLSSDS